MIDYGTPLDPKTFEPLQKKDCGCTGDDRCLECMVEKPKVRETFGKKKER